MTQYPPPPYGSQKRLPSGYPEREVPVQSEGKQYKYDNFFRHKTEKKMKKTIIFAVIGFGIMFIGGLLMNINTSFITDADAFKAMSFVGRLIINIGGLLTAIALLFGIMNTKDSVLKFGLVLAMAIVLTAYLI